MPRSLHDERVVVLAAANRHGSPLEDLVGGPFEVWPCPGTLQLLPALREGAGTAVIAKEYIDDRTLIDLVEFMREQPTWSDLPLIILTVQGSATDHAWHALNALDNVANLTLLERPMRPVTLRSAVQGALRARRRQYQVRDHLIEIAKRDAQIRDNEARLTFTLEAARVGIWEWVPGGDDAVRTSPNMQQIHGVPVHTTLPDMIAAVLPRDRERVASALRKGGGESMEVRVEYRPLQQQADTETWLELRGTVVVPSSGGPPRVVGVCVDITERKHAEARDLMTGLAHADRLAVIGQMTASILHEVGNPLAAMKTRLQTAQLAPPTNSDEFGPIIDEILVDVERLVAFLHSFRRLARNASLNRSRMPAAQMLDEVAAMMAPELRQRQLRIVVDPPDRACVVSGDPDLLRHVLVNLILNAAEASEPGRAIRLSADMHLRQGKPLTRLHVTDQGRGIPPELVERIWEPFFTTRADGSGLGLSICQRIVHAHQGTMDVRSTLGSGTVFTLVIPHAPDH